MYCLTILDIKVYTVLLLQCKLQ